MKLRQALALSGRRGKSVVLIAVAEDVTRELKVGWTLSDEVGRFGRAWVLIEAWNLYPG